METKFMFLDLIGLKMAYNSLEKPPSLLQLQF